MANPVGEKFGRTKEDIKDEDKDLRKWVLDYIKDHDHTTPRDQFFKRANSFMNWIKTGDEKNDS